MSGNAFGPLRWRRGAIGLLAGAAMIAGPGVAGAATVPAVTDATRPVRVVVQGEAGAATRVAEAVRRAGGDIRMRLDVIHGVAATVPADAVARLRAVPGVRAVTPDAPVRLTSTDFDATQHLGSLHSVARIVRATDSWQAGFTGKGVDVALIDTGVAPVPGLVSGNVVNGPDLSFESQVPELAHLDTYGHGTHMASIIAGRDVPSLPAGYADPSRFAGIAPDARLISIKVGAQDGSTDVSQVIAAINWVTEHGRRNGFDVRVLNLSFATDSTQDWRVDPLSYAAEVAWRLGVVVVAAAGNRGNDAYRLSNPAQNPNIIAVGAADPVGTIAPADDVTAAFSSRGSDSRHVDFVAPGVSVLGLRVPASAVDLRNPDAVVAGRYFRGSGTSQAAAVVSGVAALLLQRYPELTPDQVKAQLTTSAVSTASEKKLRGAGVPDVRKAQEKNPAKASAKNEWGTGTGSLELARGSAHVALDGVALTGEQDIFGRAWDGQAWAPAALAGSTWSGGTWNGSSWTGSSWTGSSWTGSTWSGTTWTGSTWTGSSWTGSSWTGNSWTGDGWNGSSWTGNWKADSWTGTSWAGAAWR